ncbi:radical SAM (seleno)protein TrsS [Desulfonatronum sp. SC1]|uniref:radical SAM (seleno)protein TrsS n=1 Tax=Desulfonatronum sp. SC1 TaxID=2109626 RepID=UPI000D300BA1|nr:radical SAM (seleno)protein TrsS [Desulfonatronum sp. SC1]PTN37848.1 radical SAM protein [Desulfonatronum sp. SC1]
MKPLQLPLSSSTASVCPECLRPLPAVLVGDGEDAYLEKRCPVHGWFKTVVWRGSPSLESWRRDKTPTSPAAPHHPGQSRGCPWDCGLCAQHRQRSCTVLVEVTGRCDLRCPVCFADSGGGADTDPDLAALDERLRRAFAQSGPVPVQLSGGEPTMRDDLPEVIALARRIGFPHVQLNTNGLRLARESGYAGTLRDAGVSWVFLQFDGTNDAVFTHLRGQPLLETKLTAIRACGQAGLGVVLVPTVTPGVNDHDLGGLIRLAARHVPTIRGVHFQPLSYFGRYPHPPDDNQRITLPEIIRGLEKQTHGQIQMDHLRPPGCEHERCSFHGNFLVQPDGVLHSLGPSRSCCGPDFSSPVDGAQTAVDVVARQWSAPRPMEEASASSAQQIPGALDVFLQQSRRTLAVTAMAFQDAWTLDLERLKGCCIHVAAPDGRLVPFCAWNLTSRNGQSPHSQRTWPC